MKYAYNDHLPDVAYSFAHLDAHGEVEIPCPRGVPWGVIEVVGVREAGAAVWAPARAYIEVLP